MPSASPTPILLLITFTMHAAEIALNCMGIYRQDEWFSEAYWRFVRIGKIAGWGGVVSVFGSTRKEKL